MAVGNRRWAWPSELRKRGVLGINARNGDYVLLRNPRCLPRVDDKLQPIIISQHGNPRARDLRGDRRCGDVRRFLELLGDRRDFVIKPASGSEGRGSSSSRTAKTRPSSPPAASGSTWPRSATTWRWSSRACTPWAASRTAPSSSSGSSSTSIFEQVAVGGTPDVRIILYRGVPVMAMVRLPTRQSRGRANLHQGAVAAGIHLRSGRTSGGFATTAAVSLHPDTAVPSKDPGADVGRPAGGRDESGRWTGVGLSGRRLRAERPAGADRPGSQYPPGLAIQVANRRGLCPRRHFIDRQPPEMLRPEHRLE